MFKKRKKKQPSKSPKELHLKKKRIKRISPSTKALGTNEFNNLYNKEEVDIVKTFIGEEIFSTETWHQKFVRISGKEEVMSFHTYMLLLHYPKNLAQKDLMWEQLLIAFDDIRSNSTNNGAQLIRFQNELTVFILRTIICRSYTTTELIPEVRFWTDFFISSKIPFLSWICESFNDVEERKSSITKLQQLHGQPDDCIERFVNSVMIFRQLCQQYTFDVDKLGVEICSEDESDCNNTILDEDPYSF